MKLSLGTVQFGIDYGITNLNGKTPMQEVQDILIFASEHNIKMLDTAPAYGESEEVLGNYSLGDFFITTKVAPVQNNIIEEKDLMIVEKIFHESLIKLNTPSVYGVFVHQTRDMYKKGAEKLYRKLREFKRQGLVKKIGISIYKAEEAQDLFGRYDWDMIQIPINIFDQRVTKANLLSELKKQQIEIHARSIFLQGVLLSQADSLDHRFRSIHSIFSTYEKELEKKGISKIESALQYIHELPEIDYAVVGVNHLNHLKEIMNAYNRVNTKNVEINYLKYAIHDERIIDPRKW